MDMGRGYAGAGTAVRAARPEVARRPRQRRRAAGGAHMLARMTGLNLSAGEQVIFQGHPSWRAILGFYLKGAVVAVILGVIAKLLGSTGLVFVVVLVVLALTVLIGFLKRWATTY